MSVEARVVTLVLYVLMYACACVSVVHACVRVQLVMSGCVTSPNFSITCHRVFACA